jgi:hypothetical protein
MVDKLAVLIVSDFRIVHVKTTYRNLFVHVDHGVRHILISLPHVECSGRYQDHTIGYLLFPPFAAGHPYQLPTIIAAFTSFAQKTATLQ